MASNDVESLSFAKTTFNSSGFFINCTKHSLLLHFLVLFKGLCVMWCNITFWGFLHTVPRNLCDYIHNLLNIPEFGFFCKSVLRIHTLKSPKYIIAVFPMIIYSRKTSIHSRPFRFQQECNSVLKTTEHNKFVFVSVFITRLDPIILFRYWILMLNTCYRIKADNFEFSYIFGMYLVKDIREGLLRSLRRLFCILWCQIWCLG